MAQKNPAANAASERGPEASVVRLTLTDFRCYQSQRLEPDSRPVVLTGANGAGKTNVLEALSMLVPGRGLRGARLSEMSRRERGEGDDSQRPWAVAAKLETASGPVDVGTGRGTDMGNGGREKRIVHIDGQTARAQSALAEHLSAHWLTPQMDRLFIEGPSARRRFLDRLVFGFDAAHAGRVSAYEHALRERSRLLRHGDPKTGRAADPQWLSVLEETMSTKGVAVAAARLDMAEKLDQISSGKSTAESAFPRASVEIVGDIEGWLAEGPALAAEDKFRAALAASRAEDTAGGSAAVGPHRSDMAVRHLGTGEMADMCSTGEQKALLIALVLANARLQEMTLGSKPLLLLDEVAAHLDETRREALFKEILSSGIQAWMTGTDTTLFAPLERNAQFFNVEDAVVTQND
ncbi:MAG: DNA replication/repair protein RecF [Rhodospirillaceae bacterium]|jgi:DNA replication and repair protein RecF|nr:DNA replication/repair protein RecF [Rhodospirillaceae bacterium]MBT4219252.1 DNA replication/repair protein RecF [Rhodospirillaceae bacterium]MBT5308824.1 DNA replication/repair protein RecF [Rhodospirillaceae bacterium]MBT6406428.1 DNA replication/repair protein RecF [Rhodospirillaceae bacterium]MBT7356452.1 DNA replication/repair protein RecF [Rhodospirillaceae bacterium]